MNELTPIQHFKALPIGTRVRVLALSGIAVLTIALTLYFVQREYRIYLDEQGDQLRERAGAVGARLTGELNQLIQAARFLVRTPPPRGIARAFSNNGLDPLADTPLELWRKRMETIFSALAESHPSYFQIRLVGIADQGRELVRVDLEDGRAKATAFDRLQNKGDHGYFKEGLHLHPGEIYLSEIDLNREHGRVALPPRPTLRAVAPIFASGKLFGFIVVNMDIGAYLDNVAANAPQGAQVLLANTDGDFLIHPDRNLTFGFDLGTRHRIIDQLPGLRLSHNSTRNVMGNNSSAIQALSLSTGKVYAVAHEIRFGSPHVDRVLKLVYTLPEDTVRAAAYDRTHPMVAALVLSALILALLVSRLVQRIFSPLGELTTIARVIGDGHYDATLPAAGSGETATFIRAFQEMLDRIRERESENIQLYAELRQSETFANSVIETTPEAILVVDPNGRMVRVNSKTEQLFGYASAEMIGQAVEMLLPEDHRHAHRSLRQGYMSQAAQRVMGESRSLRGQRKSGETFPVEIDLGPLQIGTDQYVIACVLDITKRKAAEDRIAALNATLEQQVLERTIELRKALALQQAVFDNAGLSLITTDPHGVVTTFNPAAETMLGYQAEEIVGGCELTIIHDPAEIAEHARELCRELQREIKPGFDALVAKSRLAGADTNEWTYIRKDGTRLPVLLSVTTLRNAEQNIFGYLGIAADLTERKEKEEQLRLATIAAEAANQAKSDFLANMSHEIRTPMNGVVGLTKLLQDTSLDRQQHGLLDKLVSSSTALLSILNDILDYSKIEAGKVELEQLEFQIDELLDTSATLFAQSAEEQGVEILLRVAPDVPQTLQGDPLRLSQVLNNLLGNAVKFTEQGHIQVGVRICEPSQRDAKKASAACLRFEVRDTGIGMNENQLEQLFQAFQQADSSITRKYGGTGLGLSISKRLVDLMHGEIGVESSQGHGSTFWFTAQINQVRRNSERSRALGQLRGMKVLVVDDQLTSLKILAEILQSWEFQVEVAKNAAHGLEKLLQAEQQRQPFELFLIDWKMPDVDGLELARRIDELTEQGQITRTPVVVMVTAYGHDQVLEAAGSAQLDAILDKPITSSRLFDTLVGIQNGQMPPHTNLPAEQGERIWQLTLPMHGAHVLLVEDNATNQFIATQFLNKMALRIDVAHHGREAVEMVAEHDYDAVLMDLQMPTMDGLEATRLIRTTEKGRELPIIAMTAAAMLADREATEAAGMNAHIAKPIDLDELAATLTTWITPKNSAVAGGKQSLSRGIDQDQAFALPGLNLAAAVARLDNNWSSLHKVLKAFQQDFGNSIERLHDDLKNDRYEDAKRLAHTIKGLAHSIGAETLEASAQRFERDLMSGTTHGLPDFARELDAALTAIAELQDTPHAVNEILAGQEALDSGEFRALLCELAAMVGDSIILSTDFKEQVRRGLRGHVGGADIEQLLTHVNQLDYTSAQQELKLIADRTGIDLAS